MQSLNYIFLPVAENLHLIYLNLNIKKLRVLRSYDNYTVPKLEYPYRKGWIINTCLSKYLPDNIQNGTLRCILKGITQAIAVIKASKLSYGFNGEKYVQEKWKHNNASDRFKEKNKQKGTN